MSESTKKWYVLRAAGGKEKKAKEYLDKEIERRGLQDLVSQVLVPTEKVYRIRDGKRISTERLFYPGYVLIEAELTGELQHIIRNEIPHMSGFLTEKREVQRGNGKAQEEKLPIPLRDDEVKRLIGQQDDNANTEAETVVDYQVGDAVKITDGPFEGFDGTVDEIVEDRSKLKVMVMIFGRKTLLELNFTQVTKE
ncbi:MAG: transcription termination/antitermination factor NusG [Bacteroidales bacterium]|nr:transcription termination/antitermination factor NusG [Bacteroidales bacterium]MBQ6709929.1 transcription termination/antitermination factor NusG [Bacteroidales bacterium]MBQ8048863.1 transcription termination/antitermination factor NusG [Bacteroidales bacterium]